MATRQRQSVRVSRPHLPTLARVEEAEAQPERSPAPSFERARSTASPAPDPTPRAIHNGSPTSADINAVLRLQRTHGNRFVQRLIEAPPRRPLPPLPASAAATPARQAGPAQAAAPPAAANQSTSPALASPAAPTATPAAAESTSPAPATPTVTTTSAPSAAQPASPTATGTQPATPETAQTTAPSEAAETTPTAAPDQAAAEAVPEPAPTPGPAENPAFQGVLGRLERAARQETTHAPPARLAAQASAAAVPPSNERPGRAQANQVEVMNQQEAGKPDENSFLSMLRAELQRIAPQNLKEMDTFQKQGRAGQLRGAVAGSVNSQTQAAAGDIRGATQAAPDTQSVPQQEATPLPEGQAAPPPPALNAQEAVPPPRPDAAVSAEGNVRQADQLMAENDISQEQLRNANEPQFNKALEARQQLGEHAAQLPQTYRAEEQEQLNAARGQAAADERQAVGGMRAERNRAQSGATQRQQTAKTEEEKARERLSSQINAKYEETRTKVQQKLDSIEPEVNQMFDSGEQAARQRFENYVETEKEKYKDRRYSGLDGAARWVRDLFVGLPDEANKIFEDGKKAYLNDMDAVLVRIANTVERRLKEAKTEIANGRREISAIVAAAPRELQGFARETEQNIAGKFDELQQGVDAKKGELAQKLAQRYQDASQKLDDRIKELQAENKGLLDGFIGKITEIIALLKNFRDRIGALLRQAGDVISQIVKDPIGFLKNLLEAVKQGFRQFAGNILKHLKTGLMGWLFGALSGAGLQLPETFDFKGILSIVLQILGLTVDRLRAKVAKLIGARNLRFIEMTWGYVAVLIREGPAGLWRHIKEQLTNLKEMVIDGIRDWVIEQVVKQAVIWLVSLFNPASALFKAIQAIYNTVMFFVERIEQILQLVEAVVQSVAKIVAGQIADAANWVENAMARTVPVIISFLARLLGLGGISEKIKNIITKIQDKVDKAVDKVLMKVVAGIKKLIGAGKSLAKSAVEWWKARTKFKGSDGEDHSIYFSGSGAKATLMVQSQPETYSKFIKRIKVPQDDKKLQEAKAKALQLATSIDAKKKKAAGEGTQDPGIVDDLNQLAEQTAILAGASDTNPPSVVEYDGLGVDERGRGMNAKVLSGNIPAGSPPTDSPEIWKKARRRAGVFVQGHLLNDNLGGPGRAYNLTPLTIAANNKHKDSVETDVKDLVLNKKKVVRYSVEVKYSKHPERSSEKKLRARVDKGQATKLEQEKLEIMEYEGKRLARGLECDWSTLKKKGDKWVVDEKKGSKFIENDLSDLDENFSVNK